MSEQPKPDYMDRRIAALARLGKTRAGRSIIKAHGPAILAAITMPPGKGEK